jgi:serpin B
LHIANRLWAKTGFELLADFLDITRRKYGAELAQLDFAGMTEQARQTINQWVAEHTNNKIVDLIPSGALPPEALLVLTNAVYFKGDWTEPFDRDRTQPEDFHVSATEVVKVPLMVQQDSFGYAEAEGLKILNMPYGDGTLSMTILLPDRIDGLAELESQLTADNVRDWVAMLHEREVNVQLPRFQTRSQFELNNALRALGIIAAFDASRANFQGMTGAKDLFISSVIHQAFVDVNEEGTEAAAATAIILAPTAAPADEPVVFRADHPFIFMIRDNHNGAILFLGRLVSPTPAP